MNDFKTEATLSKLEAEEDLIDIWIGVYKTKNVDVLKYAKRLQNKSYVSSATQNDGLQFEEDLSKIIDDLNINKTINQSIPPKPGTHTGGEIDLQTNKFFFELTIGNNSKLAQIQKYMNNIQDFNPS